MIGFMLVAPMVLPTGFTAPMLQRAAVSPDAVAARVHLSMVDVSSISTDNLLFGGALAASVGALFLRGDDEPSTTNTPAATRGTAEYAHKIAALKVEGAKVVARREVIAVARERLAGRVEETVGKVVPMVVPVEETVGKVVPVDGSSTISEGIVSPKKFTPARRQLAWWEQSPPI